MENLKVFKFGGASVKDANAIRNVANILELYAGDDILVIVSAMGKTTNLLESLIDAYWENREDKSNIFESFKSFHTSIIKDLKLGSDTFNTRIQDLYKSLWGKVSEQRSDNYHFEYDQIVSFGELFSTTIIAEYLNNLNNCTSWFDAREVIKTNDTFQEAKIDWDNTQIQYNEKLKLKFGSGKRVVVTQGFIGQTSGGRTTTLGREGSDFTASIFAYVGNASGVTIWKDVPGMLNADPKYFSGTVLLNKISFTEAIELAYYGASVIHPKTIQPLKRKEIPLFIKSFLNPAEQGTVIQSSTIYDEDVPSYIFKENQILISVTPKDFSFVIEDQLTEIFALLAEQKVRINLMQNSAVSFSFLIDNKYRLNDLINRLKEDYLVSHDENLELLTIRHYQDETIQRLSENKDIILIQKTAETARVILK